MVLWFIACLDRAILGADSVLAAVVAKAHFSERAAPMPLNERQIDVLNRLLDGFDAKMTTSKWATIAKYSQDSESRNISTVIKLALMQRAEAGGRNTPNVDMKRTRKARLIKSGSGRLIWRINLVAGVGFEPTTFRL